MFQLSKTLTPDLIDRLVKSGDTEVLEQLEALLDQPLHTFCPRPDSPEELDEQDSFVSDRFDGIAVAMGGNGSGKSVAGAYKAVRFLLETPPPRPLTPFLVASQTLDMCGSLAQEKYFQFIPKDLIEKVRWRNNARMWPKEIILKPDAKGNSWVLDFRSYNEGREQFQAISAGGFHIDELCPDDILTEIMARMRDYNFPGSKIYTLTPLEAAPELEERFNNRFREDVSSSWRFYRLNTDKNTTLSASWRKEFFGSLPADMVATRLVGDFAHFEGVVFKEFDSNVHIISPIEFSSDAKFYRGIDFGWRFTACVWLAKDRGTWYVFDEEQVSETLTEDFAKLVNRRPWNLASRQYGATYADYADPQSMARMGLLGVPCSQANKNVRAGIEAMRRAMIGSDGKPKFYIFASCSELIKQIKGYRWKPVPRSGASVPEEPVKKMDHILDGCRYAILSAEGQSWSPPAPPKIQQSNRKFFG